MIDDAQEMAFAAGKEVGIKEMEPWKIEAEESRAILAHHVETRDALQKALNLAQDKNRLEWSRAEAAENDKKRLAEAVRDYFVRPCDNTRRRLDALVKEAGK